MCVSNSEGVSAANEPLSQVLLNEATQVPKVSVPIKGVEDLLKKHVALLSANGVEENENQTYHLTSKETFISSNAAGTAGDAPTLVATMSPQAGALMTVTPPPESEGGAAGGILEEVVKVGVSILPIFLGVLASGKGEEPSKPQVTFEIAANGSSASITGYEVSDSAGVELGSFGVNIGCIVSNGGASILTTIVKCLPSLSSGPEAFREALVASLGSAGVDLITKVMQCF